VKIFYRGTWKRDSTNFACREVLQTSRVGGVSLEQVMNATGDALDAGLLMYSEGAVVGTGGFVESQG
jgi:hypothetical protein